MNHGAAGSGAVWKPAVPVDEDEDLVLGSVAADHAGFAFGPLPILLKFVGVDHKQVARVGVDGPELRGAVTRRSVLRLDELIAGPAVLTSTKVFGLRLEEARGHGARVHCAGGCCLFGQKVGRARDFFELKDVSTGCVQSRGKSGMLTF